MIHYHGGRHSTNAIALAIWKGRHALVSHAEPQQIPIAAEVAQSFSLDNGAFSMWRKKMPTDWPSYYEWVEEWMRHPGFDWALIPDVISGGEDQNDELLREWPFGNRGVPVWHLHESTDRLSRLCAEWPRVALGSSGEWSSPGTIRWWQRMAESMEACCNSGKPICKLHGLRMLSPRIVPFLPLSSADSAFVSTKVGRSNWGGCYKEAPGDIKAAVLVSRVEQYQSASEWREMPRQCDMFSGELFEQ